MNRRFTTLAAAAVIVVATTAQADTSVILDTFHVTPGTFGIGWNVNYDQDIGVYFSASSGIVITSFVAAMGGTGTYRFGIQGTTTTSNGLIPSSTFIHSATIVNPAYDASLSGLEWPLQPGDYYFVIQAESFGSDGGWRFGTGGLLSWNGNDAGWNSPSEPAVALTLNGNTAPIPEPASSALLSLGVALLLGARKYTTKRRSQDLSAA